MYKKDYEDFYKMTKPIKFRKLKLLTRICKDYIKSLIYGIKSIYYSLLYKLKIISKFSYKDSTEKVFPLPHPVEERRVGKNNVRGIVVCNIVRTTHLDVEYYYYKNLRTGAIKHIAFGSKNKINFSFHISAHLEDIEIKVDKWYRVSHLPKLKISALSDVAFVKSHFGHIDAEKKKFDAFQTITYDTQKLASLNFRHILGWDIDVRDMPKSAIEHHYNHSCEEFEKYINNIRLSDLMDLTE